MNDSLVWISSEWKVLVPGRPVCGLVSCHSLPKGEEEEGEENGEEREKEDRIDNDMINVEQKWEKEEHESEEQGREDEKFERGCGKGWELLWGVEGVKAE